MVRSTRVTQLHDESNSFDKSMKLVWNLMALIGIPLRPASNINRYVARFLNAAAFLINILTHGYLAYLTIHISRTKFYSGRARLNSYLEYGSYFIINQAIHFLLHHMKTSTWTSLWLKVETVEKSLQLKHDDYKKLRQTAMVAVFCISAVIPSNYSIVLKLFTNILIPNIQITLTLPISMLWFKWKQFLLFHLMHIYPSSGLMLFGLLGLMTSFMFEAIAKDIDTFRRCCRLRGSDHVDVPIRKWRRQFGLVCQLVHQINETFGVLLLISVTHLFVTAITSVNFLFEFHSSQTTSIYLNSMVLLRNITYLWFVTYVADRIGNEVISSVVLNK